ncbi:MAG: GAF domain-containing sensor histidine kinase [Pseudomonadales bacterium]
MSTDAEAARLRALESTRLLDSGPEESFDRFTRLAGAMLGAPVSLVSLVDRDRQYFKSHFGLGEPWATQRETPLSHSFCQHVVRSRQPLVISDAENDDRVRGNPAIEDLGVRAYLGVPLLGVRNQVLGSFCAIDNAPRQWRAEDVRMMQDLGAAVMREIELRSLSAEALSGLVTLQELENQRDEMVHMLVHDLRNPLTSLLAGLDMLEILPGITGQQSKYIERARNGGQAMLEMISEILVVSKSEAGRLELQRTLIDPSGLIEDSVDLLAQLAQSAGVNVTTHHADLAPFSGDLAKLQRVLANLIANALAHTPRGGHVDVSVMPNAEGGAAVFTVADSGVGISQADLGRIFDKFEQAHLTVGRERSTGLGLTFCRTVVEQHGGRIWAESEPGQGASFAFTVPFEPSPPAESHR